MSKLARLRLAAVLTLLIAGSVTDTSFALPNTYYSYWGYKPSNDNHLYSQENGANEPYPAKWWYSPPYSTASTYYRLLSNLDVNFKSAARASDLGWDNLWGGGTQWFHFYKAAPNGNDYDAAIGMAYTDPDVLGFTVTTTSSHPYLGGSEHRHAMQNGSWWMRLKYDMYEISPLYWGNGDASNLIDRQSVITHELGHTIMLNDVTLLRSEADPQTMYYTTVLPDRTGIYMRTPNSDDDFALKKLYPAH